MPSPAELLAETAPSALADGTSEAASLFRKGNVLLTQGRVAESIAYYQRSLSLDLCQPDAHNNLGLALTALGRIDAAVAHYERALVLNPGHIQANSNLGVLRAQQGRPGDALACYEKVLAIEPNHVEAHNNLGVLLTQLDRLDEAVAHFERALSVQPHHAEYHYNLGVAFWGQGRMDNAAEQYAQALSIQPGHAAAHNAMGNILKLQGHFDTALFHYDQAIAVKPDFAEAHFSRSELRKFSSGDPDLAVLETLAASTGCPPVKAPFFHFAAAKAWEDCGKYDRAFEHFRAGNTLRRRQILYREADNAALIQRIQAVFDPLLFDRLRGQGDPSSAPVFVLGMPRSGSTLVEQILSSHPSIHGAGELEAFPKAMHTEFARSGSAGQYPESARLLDGAAARRIGSQYLAQLPSAAGQAARVVDKMPDNFFSVGLLHLTLPNARIIHTVRHPMDTCWSCYSRLFTTGQPFSYDLGELARYYRRYEELMAHWRAVLPSGVMIDVAYEDVVEDLEGQARRLIEFCGLAWDDRCLSFHQNRRTVKTASAVQVRRPLYRSSLQRWRRYEPWLGPLLRELGENATDVRLSPGYTRETFLSRESQIACTASVPVHY